MRISTNVYYGVLCFLMLSFCSTVVAQDNLGNHTATTHLEMSNKNINGVTHLYTNGLTVGNASSSEIIEMKTDAAAWNLVVTTAEDFKIRDVLGGNLNPFTIQDGTPSNLLFLRNNGRVGIGTTTPDQELEVDGDILAERLYTLNSSFGTVAEFRTNDGINNPRLLVESSAEGMTLKATYSTGANSLMFATGGSERMRLLGPNLGIGTTTPTEALEVKGSIKISQGAGAIKGPTNQSLRLFGYPNGADEGMIFSNDGGTTTHMFIERDGNVGIGTANPSAKLHIESETNNNNRLQIDLGSASNNTGVLITANAIAHGSDWIRTQGDDPEDNFIVRGDGAVGIGIADPGTWKLAVNGKIRTKEVKVELANWPDFVFYPDYKLPTLEEVESQIKENGHLKDIPSAKEVEENGVLLGEMDSKLLQKIEELTLYAIERKKEVEELKKEVQLLKELMLKDK